MEGLIVLVVGGKRFLINNESKSCDKTCERIIKNFPVDALVEFDEVRKIDVLR